MIRFVDLENGNVYNGSKPYIFWMNEQQSVNMIYVKKICVLTNTKIASVSIPENDIYRLLEMQKLDSIADTKINDFDYKDISKLYTNSYESEGVAYRNKLLPFGPRLYVHMIYISASSENIGEFHEDFTINNEMFEIAADFYAENEALKINLSNFGVELPQPIQNAIYDTNVHEEAKDDITLNRKYKELLLNYWNIVASRGSYQSLLDSLNWFEYGDLVKIDELWKHSEWSMDRLNREELNLIMTEKIRSTLANFSKTTYIGLYLALQKYVTEDGIVQYDKLISTELENSNESVALKSSQIDRLMYNDNDTTTGEYNDVNSLSLESNLIRDNADNYNGFLGEEVPLLKNKIFKWSVEDLSLKMYLLGSFYEAYFMPIHLDLLHSTIEELVFTNTIKCISTNNLDRNDYAYNTETFSCNVKNNSTYKLQDVNIQAGSMLNRHWSDSDDNYVTPMVYSYDGVVDSDDEYNLPIFGVEEEYNHPMQLEDESSDDEKVNSRLKTFMINNFNGLGVVIPFNCIIPAEEDDFINQERIIVSNEHSIKEMTKNILYAAIKENNEYHYYVDFNLLLTEEGENTITLCFLTAGGRMYVRSIHVILVGDVSCKLKLYKVKSSSLLKLDDFDYEKQLDNLTTYTREFRKNYIRTFNDYFFTHTRDNKRLIDQDGYIPVTTKVFVPGSSINTIEDNGIKYNHIIIFDELKLEDINVKNMYDEVKYLFDISIKHVQTETTNKNYLILISTNFYDPNPESAIEQKIKLFVDTLRSINGIYRYSLGYFYQHHYLETLGVGKYMEDNKEKYKYGLSLDDYTINDKDTLCVVPEMKYSNVDLDDTEWIFTNVTLIHKPSYKFTSVKEPFIGKDIKENLEPGFYNVTFRYKIGNTWNETTLDSAFRKI